MSEPKKQELANLQVQNNLALVNAAKVSQLVYKSAEETLVVDDTVIHCTTSGLFCLNDLFKALKGPDHKRPSEFLRTKAAQDVIAELQAAGIQDSYETVVGGSEPGTYAHKLLAYEYATYLNKSFKLRSLIVMDMVINAQVRKVQEDRRIAVEQLGEEKAKLIETVAELQAVTKDARDSRILISALEQQAGYFESTGQKPKLVMDYIGLQKVTTHKVTVAIGTANGVMLDTSEDIDSVIFTIVGKLRSDISNQWRNFLTQNLLEPLQGISNNLKTKLAETTEELRKAKAFKGGVDQFLDNRTN